MKRMERVFDTLREDSESAWSSILDMEDDEDSADEPPEAVSDLARGSGRPGWTPAVFWEHWREALAEAAPSHRFADVAANFRALDGNIGIDPEHLRKLVRRFPRPAHPE